MWNTGDTRYTRFRCPRFWISLEAKTSSSQPNFKDYFLRRTFPRLVSESDADDNININESWCQFNIKILTYRFPALRIGGDAQECNVHVLPATCTKTSLANKN
jgi:hypothetical protein